MRSLIEFYSSLDEKLKKNSFIIFLTYLLVLFSYPFVRASVGAIFYEHYTSAQFSFATFLSVIILFGSIYISNSIQQKYGVHRLFLAISGITIVGLAGSFFFLQFGIKEFAFLLFAAKEIYIVLFVHLVLAYANNYYSLDQVKKLYGPLGAAGSLGGIVGGVLTTTLAKTMGTNTVFFISLFIIAGVGLVFWFTQRIDDETTKTKKKVSPLQSISNIKKYVMLIALVIAVSQWIIFLADLQFNIQFEKLIETKDERTSYLATMFSMVNVLTLILQIFVIPFVLTRVSTKRVFYFLPVFYLLLVLGSQFMGVSSLFLIACVFTLMKASDYSIFTVAKEIMYHPLTGSQKYGTKYITDIFSYRLSKALIALATSLFSLSSMGIINGLQLFFIILWFIMIAALFREQNRLK